MTAGRGYVVAVLLGLAAATLVFWQLESSESTACFRESVRIADSGSTEVLQGCESNSFDAVRHALEAQGSSAASDEPSALEARSALIVWMALFAATAGFAAIVAVRSELSLAKELHAALGAGGALKSLQGSLAVLAPVVAAAVSSLFA